MQPEVPAIGVLRGFSRWCFLVDRYDAARFEVFFNYEEFSLIKLTPLMVYTDDYVGEGGRWKESGNLIMRM